MPATATRPQIATLEHGNFCARCDEFIGRGNQAVLTNPPTCLDCATLPDVVTDRAGASLMRWHDASLAAHRRRQTERWKALGPIVTKLSRTPSWISVKKIGAKGEQLTGKTLEKIPGAVVLHGRQRPGKGQADLDHVVIAPSGIWICDTKRYAEVFGPNARAVSRETYRRVDKTVRAMANQIIDVRTGLGPLANKVPVQGCVCFTGSLHVRKRLGTRQVWICRRRHLKRLISKAPVTVDDVDKLARIVADLLPQHR